MEWEKMKTKSCCYCAAGLFIWSFVLLIYVAISRLDDEEHIRKGVLEIKMFPPWKDKELFPTKAKEDEDLTNWMLLRSLGRQIIDFRSKVVTYTNNAKGHKNEIKDKNPGIFYTLKNVYSSILSELDHPIRNWLSEKRNVKFRPSKNISFDSMIVDKDRHVIVHRMREKIVDMYGDTIVLPLNESLSINVRKWRITSNTAGNSFRYNFGPKKYPSVISTLEEGQKTMASSKSLDLASKGVGKMVSKSSHLGNKLRTKEETRIIDPDLAVLPTEVDLLPNKLQPPEGFIQNGAKKDPDAIAKNILSPLSNREINNKNEILPTEHIQPLESFDNQMILPVMQPSNKPEEEEELYPHPLDPDDSFILSKNDTDHLRKLSRKPSEYVDTTNEENVKNEIGPISDYVDKIYREEAIADRREEYVD